MASVMIVPTMMMAFADMIRAVNETNRPTSDDLRRWLQQVEEEAKKAKEEAKKAKEAWNAGVRPEEIPTPEEIEEAKRSNRYDRALWNFAATGVSGGGKSSLVNALRGVRYGAEGFAEVGIVETTKVVGRYPDPKDGFPFVWYDLPGSGTLTVSDWKYFITNSLFIFDRIIVCTDNRFLESEIAIIRNCERFRIPCFLVRSKSDIHIRNEMQVKGYTEAEARAEFIRETQESVKKNLAEAKLPDMKVYIVSAVEILKLVSGVEATPNATIDERALISDLIASTKTGRGTEGQS